MFTTSHTWENKWRTKTCHFPAEVSQALEVFSDGCGICGDDEETLIVLWRGMVLFWVIREENTYKLTDPKKQRRPSVVDETSSPTDDRKGGCHRFATNDISIAELSVSAARSLPRKRVVATIMSDGTVRLLQIDGSLCSASEVSVDISPPVFFAVGLQTLRNQCFAIVTKNGALGKLHYFERSASRRAEITYGCWQLGGKFSLPMDSVEATAARPMSIPQRRGNSGESGAASAIKRKRKPVIVLAGGSRSVKTGSQFVDSDPVVVILRFWLLDASSDVVGSCDELEIACGGGVHKSTVRPTVLSVCIANCGKKAAALTSDGSVYTAALSENDGDAWTWSFGNQLCGSLVPQFRLAAMAGLSDVTFADPNILGNELPLRLKLLPCGLQVCGDDSLALVFPGVADDTHPQVADIVCVNFSDLCLERENPYVPLLQALPIMVGTSRRGRFPTSSGAATMCGWQRYCASGWGFAGNHLIFLSVDQGAANGENMFLSSQSRPSPRQPYPISSGSCLQRFRNAILSSDLEKFTSTALAYDPFLFSEPRRTPGGIEQVSKLLRMAKARLERALNKLGPVTTCTGSGGIACGGWDLDFSVESDSGPAKADALAMSTNERVTKSDWGKLLERVEHQLGRLVVFGQAHGISESARRVASSCSLQWSGFREIAASSLPTMAKQAAAECCVPVLEALLKQHKAELAVVWPDVLDTLPETADPFELQPILPASAHASANTVLKLDFDFSSWYMRRARNIIDRSGITENSLKLLLHGIHAILGKDWPNANTFEPDSLLLSSFFLPVPEEEVLQSGVYQARGLYGMFRLCSEYLVYSRVAAERMFLRGGGIPSDLKCILTFGEFCTLDPAHRAQLALRDTSPCDFVEDARNWVACVSLSHLYLGATSPPHQKKASPFLSPDLQPAIEDACSMPAEDALLKAIIGRVNERGWEPASMQLASQVVAASSPALPPNKRVLKSQLAVLELILGALYSGAVRCRALDIFQFADSMYGHIPKKETGDYLSGIERERWNDLQKQADELHEHLNCLEMLAKYAVDLSISFTDLRRGCSDEISGASSMSGLFRALGTKYRPASFWRAFREEMMYLHQHAFRAASHHVVYEMYAGILADQEHWEVLADAAVEWASVCGISNVSNSLVCFARELVNASPALRHYSLEKAKRVLRSAPDATPAARAELDFIGACEMIHDLALRPNASVAARPRHFGGAAHRWAEDLRGVCAGSNAVTAAPELTPLGTTDGMRKIEPGFPVDCPLKLRLQLNQNNQPARVVVDLFQFNPTVFLDSDDLHSLCALLGLAPNSSQWAEVMALSGAANLLFGSLTEAKAVAEKLLISGHSETWKLAVAVADADYTGISTMPSRSRGYADDVVSPLLADATKLCKPHDLPALFGTIFPHQRRTSNFSSDWRPPLNPENRLGVYSGAANTPSFFSASARLALGMASVSHHEVGDDCRSWDNFYASVSADVNIAVDANADARNLPCRPEAEKKRMSLNSLGEFCLAIDRDLGLVILDVIGEELPDVPNATSRGETRVAPLGNKTAAGEHPENRDANVDLVPSGGIGFPTASQVQQSTLLQTERLVGGVDAQTELATLGSEDWSRDWFCDEGGQATGGGAVLQVLESTEIQFASQEQHILGETLSMLKEPSSTRAAAERILQRLQADNTNLRSECPSRVALCNNVMNICEQVSSTMPVGECPETEGALIQQDGVAMDADPLSSQFLCRLQFLCQTCQEDMELVAAAGKITHRSSDAELSVLVEHIFRIVQADPIGVAPRLVEEIAGSDRFQKVGVNPSSIALCACRSLIVQRSSASETTAVAGIHFSALIPWMVPHDAALFAAEVINSDVDMSAMPWQMEIISSIRDLLAATIANCFPHTVLLQAEALLMLRTAFAAAVADVRNNCHGSFEGEVAASVVSLPAKICVDPEVEFDTARQTWLLALTDVAAAAAPNSVDTRTLSVFLPVASSILDSERGQPKR